MNPQTTNEDKETRPWAEEVAAEVLKRKKKTFVCEGMWTPSGFFHIGNARPEIFTPYAVKKAIEERKKQVVQNFIIDDFDAIRKIPDGLGILEKDHAKYLGFPCATAPSPITGYKSWAEAFVSQVREFAPAFGVKLNIISAYETYQSGKFNELIIFTMGHSKEIVKVWKTVSGTQKNEEEFVPIQIVCEKCKRIYYTKITEWDGKQAAYSCDCGHNGKESPLNGNAKLNWRVHWVAHWILHEVDFESGGKDHFSKGGSVDVGRALMHEVFKKEPPVQIPTEFIQLAGEKMSGSKGNVINLEQWLAVASPELFRFMNFSYRPNTVIEFSLSDNSFILLNDRFDRCERIFYGHEKPTANESEEKLKRVYQMALLEKPNPRPVQVPFPFLASISQLFDPKTQLEEAISIFVQTEHLPKDLNKNEKKMVQQKMERARNWIERFAPENYKIAFLEKTPPGIQMNANQKNALREIAQTIRKQNKPDEIQKTVYDVSRKHQNEPKEIFQLIYQITLGKTSGPKVGHLVFAFGKEKVAKRLEETAK